MQLDSNFNTILNFGPMVSRSKYIKKAIVRSSLLIVAIGIIYFGMNMNKKTDDNTEKKPPVILSYDEMMNTATIKNGKILFHDNCAACHSLRETDGMMFEEFVDSAYDKNVLYAFIRNPDSLLKSGNVHYNNLVKEYYPTRMTAFPNLTDSALDNIMLYIKAVMIYRQIPHQ